MTEWEIVDMLYMTVIESLCMICILIKGLHYCLWFNTEWETCARS